jgi:hypothetical protein
MYLETDPSMYVTGRTGALQSRKPTGQRTPQIDLVPARTYSARDGSVRGHLPCVHALSPERDTTERTNVAGHRWSRRSEDFFSRCVQTGDGHPDLVARAPRLAGLLPLLLLQLRSRCCRARAVSVGKLFVHAVLFFLAFSVLCGLAMNVSPADVDARPRFPYTWPLVVVTGELVVQEGNLSLKINTTYIYYNK